jgi:hypothetical protein
MTKSPYINHAINLSLLEGNSVQEVYDGCSTLEQVVFFQKKCHLNCVLKLDLNYPH